MVCQGSIWLTYSTCTGMEGIALLPTREDKSSSTLTEATWNIVGYELFFSSFSPSRLLSSLLCFLTPRVYLVLSSLIYFIIFLIIKFFFFFLEIKEKCFNYSRWKTYSNIFIFVKKRKIKRSLIKVLILFIRNNK